MNSNPTLHAQRLLAASLSLLVLWASVTACQGPAMSSGDFGRLTIRALSAGSGTTNLAPANVVLAYHAVLTPTHGDAIVADLSVTSTFELSPGAWHIVVEGVSVDQDVLTRGSADVTVQTGTVTLPVALAPVGGGQGTFRLNLAGISDVYSDFLDVTLYPWPADPAAPADLTEYSSLPNASSETAPSGGSAGLLTNALYTLDKTAKTGSVAGSLPSGTYLVQLTLHWSSQGDFIINTWTRLVEIWDGEHTEATLPPSPTF